MYTFISIVRSGQLLIIHQSATLGASFVVRALELIQHAYIYLYNTYGYNTYPYLSIYTYTHKPFISDITRETNHGSTSNHLLTLVLVVKHGIPELWIGNSSSSGWSWIFLLAVFDSQREYHFEWLPKMDIKPQESAPLGPTDIYLQYPWHIQMASCWTIRNHPQCHQYSIWSTFISLVEKTCWWFQSFQSPETHKKPLANKLLGIIIAGCRQ